MDRDDARTPTRELLNTRARGASRPVAERLRDTARQVVTGLKERLGILSRDEDSSAKHLDGKSGWSQDFQRNAEVKALVQFVRELQPNKWERLGVGNDGKPLDPKKECQRRVEVLQRAERHMSALQGRPEAQIVFASYAACFDAKYNSQENAITFERELLRNSHFEEVLRTYFHESRHAYQIHVLAHPGRHPEVDDKTHKLWQKSIETYPKWLPRDEWEQAIYEQHPWEVDARGYADEMVRRFDEQRQKKNGR